MRLKRKKSKNNKQKKRFNFNLTILKLMKIIQTNGAQLFILQ